MKISHWLLLVLTLPQLLLPAMAADKADEEEKRHRLNDIAVGPDGHVVVVGGFREKTGVIVDSADGENWFAQTPGVQPVEQGLMGVTHGAGQFVAVGNVGVVMSSRNGSDWRQETLIPREFWLMDVDYAEGKFVAGGVSGLYTSTDAKDWASIANVGNVYGITHGNGLFVAVGYAGAIYTSPDAVTWTKRDTQTGFMLRSVAYGNGVFIAVGGEGQHGMVISYDGIDWFTSSSGSQAQLMDIAFADGMFYLVGGTWDRGPREFTGGTIEYSANGRDWVTYFAEGTTRLDALARRGPEWLVIGEQGYIGKIGKGGLGLHLTALMSGERLALAMGSTLEKTAPKSAGLVLPKLSTAPVAGGLSISWQSTPGMTYRVRRSADLKLWEDTGVSYTGTGEVMSHQEKFIPGHDTLYFRLEIY